MPGSDRTARDTGFLIQDLEVAFVQRGKQVPVVGGVRIEVKRGRITGIAGESGSGKTTAVLSAIGYLPTGAIRLAGDATLDGESILRLKPRQLRALWATRVSYVAQDAANALNPAHRVGSQLRELLEVNLGMSSRDARERAVELLQAVHLPNPDRALRRYPHEFSGGQLQRIAIAMGIACNPELIIFDEPTTGLDVTTQAEVIQMLNALIRSQKMAALYISHDLALLGSIADDLVIFYAGEVVESGLTAEVIRAPAHPYTRALLDALPSIREARRPRGLAGLPPGRVISEGCPFAARCEWRLPSCEASHPNLLPLSGDRLVRCFRATDLWPLAPGLLRDVGKDTDGRSGESVLTVEDVVCSYGKGRRRLRAVDHVSFQVHSGEVVGLVGESGSGKSTLGRAVVGIIPIEMGTISLAATALKAGGRRSRSQHRDIQIIFQNPDSSLNPRHTIGRLVRRSLELFRSDVPAAQRSLAVEQALLEVQLDPAMVDRYPHQLSGGQKQRVAIARAFIARPRLVICDEIVSGLDVSVQAAILDLVRRMQLEYGTALLFISHDLAVVRSIAQYVYVIQRGRIQEEGLTSALFDHPANPYTRQLLASVLEPTASVDESLMVAHDR